MNSAGLRVRKALDYRGKMLSRTRCKRRDSSGTNSAVCEGGRREVVGAGVLRLRTRSSLHAIQSHDRPAAPRSFPSLDPKSPLHSRGSNQHVMAGLALLSEARALRFGQHFLIYESKTQQYYIHSNAQFRDILQKHACCVTRSA